MSEQSNLGFGHTDWTRSAGRARKIKEQYVAAKKGQRGVRRSIATEIRKITYAQRNPWNHAAVRETRAAEARLVELRSAEAGFADQMRSLEREAVAL